MANGNGSKMTDDQAPRTLQITISRETEILLARLCAKAVEEGQRPADCTKSKVLDRAIRALAATHKVTPDTGAVGQ